MSETLVEVLEDLPLNTHSRTICRDLRNKTMRGQWIENNGPIQPDLSLVVFSLWRFFEDKVNGSAFGNIDELKETISRVCMAISSQMLENCHTNTTERANMCLHLIR